ncbi:MAG TPA: site-2 protease family protein, partial [Anaerolineales bacterium]|nr:site-2 protease family protein [Anaerolineales bacterium]
EVRAVMDVQEYESGATGSHFLATYRGKLRIESDQAYARLEPVFARAGSTILLRQEGETQILIAVEELKARKAGNPLLNVVLFLATFATVLFVGLSYAQAYLQQTPSARELPIIGQPLPLALLYAGSLLGILVAHEFGHYLMGRYHKTAVTLPYFIPFPGGLFGTFGAFIQLRSPPKNRRVLMDIGLAGPLAGLVIAVPVLLIGLALSQVTPLPSRPAELSGNFMEGNSLLYLGAKFLVKGELLPEPVDYLGVPPLTYWLRNLVFGVGGPAGVPIPLGGLDVQLHPMALAGWAGFLVTGLNLIPTGQLDGGHVLYSLLGRRAAILWPVIIAGLLGLTLVWNGWLLFAGLTFLMGRTYAQPLDDVTPLDGRRRGLAILGLVLFVLIFTPVPIVPLLGR